MNKTLSFWGVWRKRMVMVKKKNAGHHCKKKSSKTTTFQGWERQCEREHKNWDEEFCDLEAEGAYIKDIKQGSRPAMENRKKEAEDYESFEKSSAALKIKLEHLWKKSLKLTQFLLRIFQMRHYWRRISSTLYRRIRKRRKTYPSRKMKLTS